MDYKDVINEDYVVDFGKHKGKKIKDIPAGWFLYLYRQDILFGMLKDWVKANKGELERRKKKEEENKKD